MKSKADTKQLVKILIGAAWIDGRIQPEERQYLQQIVTEKNLGDDPEIRPLLGELVPVKPDQCYEWIREYLGDRPNPEDYQKLLSAISGLIYSDGTIETEEAKLLTRLQLLDPAGSHEPAHSAVLRAIQKMYRSWLTEQR